MTIEPLEPRCLLAAGELDTHFGDRGSILLTNTRVSSQSLIIDAVGGIVAATIEARPDDPFSDVLRLRRFTAGGMLDPTFRSPIDDQPLTETHGQHVQLAHVAAGFLLSIDDQIERFHADGSLDTDFGDRGVVSLSAAVGTFGVQGDGSILASGLVQRAGLTGFAWIFDPTLTRLHPDGSFDESFGPAGRRVLPIIDSNLQLEIDQHVSAHVWNILPDPDGSAYVIATRVDSYFDADPEFGGIDHDYEFAFLIHINADGSFDTNLDGDGVLQFVPPGTEEDNYHAAGFTGFAVVRVEKSGQLLMLANTVDSIHTLSRVNAQGSFLGYPNFQFFRDDLDVFDGIQSALLMADGSVIAARDATDSNTPDQYSLRHLNADLSEDASFNSSAAIEPGGISLAIAQDGSILEVIHRDGGENENGTVLRRIWRTDAPAAELSAPAIGSNKSGSHVLTVTYRDDQAIDVSSLDNRDLRVTGPNGFVAYAKFDRIIKTRLRGSWVRVRYKLTPPGGAWDAADNGMFSVRSRAGQVSDNTGHGIDARTIGTLTVNIGAGSRASHFAATEPGQWSSMPIRSDDDKQLVDLLFI